jgi:hypothetical protein
MDELDTHKMYNGNTNSGIANQLIVKLNIPIRKTIPNPTMNIIENAKN